MGNHYLPRSYLDGFTCRDTKRLWVVPVTFLRYESRLLAKHALGPNKPYDKRLGFGKTILSANIARDGQHIIA